MRFAGDAFANLAQQTGTTGKGINISALTQQYGDQAALPGTFGKAVSRGKTFGEVVTGTAPGLGLLGGKDPTNQWAMQAIEAGGSKLPFVGAAWLGINAGPVGDGTLDAARRRGLVR